jgi:hypothetical protein
MTEQYGAKVTFKDNQVTGTAKVRIEAGSITDAEIKAADAVKRTFSTPVEIVKIVAYRMNRKPSAS